jgi:gas vesicle protein
MAEDRHDGGALVYFLFGAVVGAGLALLLTPKTGKEVQEILKEKGSEFAKRAKEGMGERRERAEDFLEKGREFVEEQSHRLVSAFEAGKEAMREEFAKRRGGGDDVGV